MREGGAPQAGVSCVGLLPLLVRSFVCCDKPINGDLFILTKSFTVNQLSTTDHMLTDLGFNSIGDDGVCVLSTVITVCCHLRFGCDCVERGRRMSVFDWCGRVVYEYTERLQPMLRGVVTRKVVVTNQGGVVTTLARGL